MANDKAHDHTAGDNGLVQYGRTVSGKHYDTGKRISRDELAGPPQQYVDHAGRPTTVKEYKSGGIDVFVGDDQPRYWQKERIVSEAQQLATTTTWKTSGERLNLLLDEWKSVGRIDKRVDEQLWNQFDAARKQFKDNRQRYFDQLKNEQAQASADKSRIANRAEALVTATDQKAASEEMKRLMDQWKRAGRCDRTEEERLWSRFDGARKQLQTRRNQDFEKRKREWDSNKSAKERVVREAESQANSANLKAATDAMRSLQDQWKQIGPCEKSDSERLWAAFNSARTKLNDRKTREFEKRKQEWAANRAAKERIASQAESLSSSTDLRAAGDSMRALTDQWKQIGPCDKADNERLWTRFSNAKNRLRERRQRDFEDRKADRKRKAQEYVYRLEEQLRNTEAAMYRAQEYYSRALSARSPSMSNPNWYSIVANQQERQSSARSKVSSLESRRADIVTKLMNARSQLNAL